MSTFPCFDNILAQLDNWKFSPKYEKSNMINTGASLSTLNKNS